MLDMLLIYSQSKLGPLWGPAVYETAVNLAFIVAIVVPLFLSVAYLTLWERKLIGWIQIRIGPNRVGPLGLLQPIADGIKLLFKEIILPRAEKLLFPGVADGLATLRDQGFTLAVATSKFYVSADALLAAAGIRDRFAMVIGADQVTCPKPDPEMAQVIMREFGVSAERAVMVGDTTHDLLMAMAAGMRSIAVTYGVHSVQELKSADPTWIADTFDDVLKCVQAGYPEPTGAGDRDPPFGSTTTPESPKSLM